MLYLDENIGIKIDENQLLKELNGELLFKPYLVTSNIKQYLKNFFAGLINDEFIALIDLNYSLKEISNIIGNTKLLTETKIISTKIRSLDDFYWKIEDSKSKIGIFTSGTTGKPKLVKHLIKNFILNVRNDKKHTMDIWGLAYNPTHMAGVQVIFQALLNKNRLINIFYKDRDFVIEQIEKHKITHISATPTWYRLLIDKNLRLRSVKSVTLGGENFDKPLYEDLRIIFPNAKITNIYASTEVGSLFTSRDDLFVVKKEIKSFVKIESNNLFVHKNLLGEFDYKLDGEWFNTGDKVDIISDAPLTIKFFGRDGDFINIGGYKVNPFEIEEILREHPQVINCKVYSQKNSVIGNIILADVIRRTNTISEKKLIDYLSKSLQGYKIPRVIKFVNNIEFTRTGKIKR